MENLPQPVGEQSKAREAAGKAVGVSGKSLDVHHLGDSGTSLDDATRVLSTGITALVQAVEDGRIWHTPVCMVAFVPCFVV